ncbi:MAG: PepSY-associated TM helix domain-containing protein, partial [Pacificimonas sp.]
SDAAARQFPDAAPRMLVPGDDDRWHLRLRTEGEAHPNGRTTLTWDAERGMVVDARYAPHMGVGRRFQDLLYPLHIGSLGGWPLKLLWFAAGLGTLALGWTGLRRLKWSAAKRPEAAPPRRRTVRPAN